jgi:hypothetical protein
MGRGVNRLGIVGTMVWDTIYGRGESAEPVEEWGGIAYALSALEVSLPRNWEIVPLIKVGRDLAPRANTFLNSLTKRSSAARFIEVPEPNNRVTLRYESEKRRAERLSGGVPPWQWHELGPLVRDLQAIYVNFISGFELTLDTARQLRQAFHGPMYADLHSLLLGVACDGTRVPQRLPDIAEWFTCFDVVQLNEDELALVGDEPLEVAARAMGCGVRLLVVTLGDQGAVYFTAKEFRFAEERGGPAMVQQPLQTARVETLKVEVLDPTGCGDVFGGALAAQLIRGRDVARAVEAANVLAARNVQYRGATSLHHHLRGEIVPT